jgi:hypothetical protein
MTKKVTMGVYLPPGRVGEQAKLAQIPILLKTVAVQLALDYAVLPQLQRCVKQNTVGNCIFSRRRMLSGRLI